MKQHDTIRVLYMPERGANTSEYEFKRERCIAFNMPKAVLFDISLHKLLLLPNGLEVYPHYSYACARCKSNLIHTKSSSEGAILECKCGEWVGECSPFSGNYYGSELKYTPFTKQEIEERMQREIEEVKNRYNNIEQVT